MPVRFVEGPTLEQMLDPEPVEVYPYDVTLEEVKRQTPLILHTSGSTGKILGLCLQKAPVG